MILENIIESYIQEKQAGLGRDLLFGAGKLIRKATKGGKRGGKWLKNIGEKFISAGSKETPYLTRGAAKAGMKIRGTNPNKFNIVGGGLGKVSVKAGGASKTVKSAKGAGGISKKPLEPDLIIPAHQPLPGSGSHPVLSASPPKQLPSSTHQPLPAAAPKTPAPAPAPSPAAPGPSPTPKPTPNPSLDKALSKQMRRAEGWKQYGMKQRGEAKKWEKAAKWGIPAALGVGVVGTAGVGYLSSKKNQ